MNEFYKEIVEFIKKIYKKSKIGLHEPIFLGNEKKYLENCIDTTFVSYVGEYVTQFEQQISEFTGVKNAIAVVNGTVALYIILKSIGVENQDEVITQPLTFVATSNSIAHCGAYPTYVDIDLDTLGMSPESLSDFLQNYTKYDKQSKTIINKYTGRKIKAIVPVHIFGHPCKIDEIIKIAYNYNLPVIEDAAEALGSFYKNIHCGSYGLASILSFNGNKTLTTGGGGMILTNDDNLAQFIRHITTTAKVKHPWEYFHDKVGYNFRLPNLNAAIGVAQMEYLENILQNKRETAELYKIFFENSKVKFFVEPKDSRSNYWLNAIIFENFQQKEEFLKFSNENGVMTRPVWKLMYKLPMYKDAFKINTPNSEFIEEKLVNLPSGYRV